MKPPEQRGITGILAQRLHHGAGGKRQYTTGLVASDNKVLSFL